MKINLSVSIASSLLGLGALLLISSCSKEPEVEVVKKPSREVSLITDKAAEWKFGEQAYKHAGKIVEFGPRPAQSKALEQTRQYIKTELEKRKWSVKRQSFVVDTGFGKYQFVNLMARYLPEGKDLDTVWRSGHRGVIGAHIDTKKIPGLNYVGAVDAAGSVGQLIEMADFLGKYAPAMAAQVELVFFDGEEALGKNMFYESSGKDGLYGSHYYALNRNRKREFGIILDLLGQKNQKVKVPSDSPVFLYKDLMEIARRHGVEKSFGKADFPILDDHVPLEVFGTPSIDIIAEFSSTDGWWHQEGDKLDQLSVEQLGVSLRVAIDLVATQLKK